MGSTSLCFACNMNQCPGRKFLGMYIYIVSEDPSDSKSSRLHVRHLPVLLSFI